MPATSIRFDVLTIFPGMFEGPLTESILGRARERGLMIDLRRHDARPIRSPKALKSFLCEFKRLGFHGL